MQNLLSLLPKIDNILKHKDFAHYNPVLLKQIAKEILQDIRKKILQKTIATTPRQEEIFSCIQKKYHQITTPSFQPLINATGIVLQTNLGRSIFSPSIIHKSLPLLSEYNNLEYDLIKGERGERYTHVKEIICALFECEDALVVNNNAAAVMLIINTFAKEKEVVISRGELVEIGGSFRIPEVIKQSGAKLIEVGATNKTHLKDYQNAINEETTMLLKVHQSNFSQTGFVQHVDFKEIKELAQKHNIIDYYDVGSGYIKGISCNEPSLIEIAKLSPSLVSFSGDKLLGGPQAGIIFGKTHLIEKLKKNHLLRALRIDKISLIFLQETLLAYLHNSLQEIPTIALLNQDIKEILQKAKDLLELLKNLKNFSTQIIPTTSKAGGGSLPDMIFDSYAIALQHNHKNVQSLSVKLRLQGLIARIKNNQILLDLRCINQEHFTKIQNILEDLD